MNHLPFHVLWHTVSFTLGSRIFNTNNLALSTILWGPNKNTIKGYSNINNKNRYDAIVNSKKFQSSNESMQIISN